MGRASVAVACATACVALLAAAGCTAREVQPDPVSLAWQEITLPDPPAGTRTVLAAGAFCGGRWYLVGGYGRIAGAADGGPLLGADDDMDPAAWTSLDGTTWTSLPVAASSYYGVRSLLWSVACRGEGPAGEPDVVALGGKVGGAHGNPRMASYFPRPGAGGTVALTEVGASFELYGGPKATNVGRIAAGPPGYLIVGNRSAGAAVWLSATGEQFEIVEGAPVLSDSPERATWAADAEFHDGEWVVVGSIVRTGRADRDPAAWRSRDGHAWTAMQAQAEPDYDEFSVAAPVAGSLTAIGNHQQTFQAWRLESDGWRPAGRFGSTRVEMRDGTLTSAVPIDLQACGGRLFALVKAGWEHQLWTSVDAGGTWRPVAPPAALPASGDQRAAIVGTPGTSGGRLLLVADDGQRARAFIAPVDAG